MATPTPTAVVTAGDSAGHSLYVSTCRKCHGTTGDPSSVMRTKFPKIARFDAAFFARRSTDSVVTVLVNGNGEHMKSYSDKLSLAEMRAVATYLRTLAK